jgi:DNA topoisomerase-1
MNIVVVESPAKAKTINKYLGSGYEVLASFGHVRDLPAKNGSVDPDADFRMIWEVDAKAQKRLSDIARAVKGADKLILATDPDREGEAISWHVLQVLKEKHALKGQKIERVVFNAITKQSIVEAMKHPREIDGALVDAYLARRALDYLVGFTLSPVLWRKLPGARSAGRVQSVALRLVCDRELEIEKFVAREYWSLVATLATPRQETFEARLVGADGRKIQRLDIGTGAEAEAFRRDLESAQFSVAAVEAKPGKRNPPPPFTTSTMQQEASRKFGFAPAHTMRVAQRLYEGIDIGGETVGLITYMRTDGRVHRRRGDRRDAQHHRVDLRQGLCPGRAARLPDQAEDRAGSPRSGAPDRRDAPPARRRQISRFRSGPALRTGLAARDGEPDGIGRTGAHHRGHRRQGRPRLLDLRATGTVIKFDGFLTLYQEGQDDEQDDEEGKRLPAMSAGERSKSARSPPRSISPSRRRATRKPRWSSAWKSSASAGPRPMRRSSRC